VAATFSVKSAVLHKGCIFAWNSAIYSDLPCTYTSRTIVVKFLDFNQYVFQIFVFGFIMQ